MGGQLPAETTLGPQSAVGLFKADLEGQSDDLLVAVTPQLPTTETIPYRREYFLTKRELLALSLPTFEPVTRYVTATKLNVRSGPGTTYPIVATLVNGAQVTIVDVSGTWSKTAKGWVSNDYLSETAPKA